MQDSPTPNIPKIAPSVLGLLKISTMSDLAHLPLHNACG